MNSTFQRLKSIFNKYSAKKLIARLLWFQVLCIFVIVAAGYVDKKFNNTTATIQPLLLCLNGFVLMLMMLGLFLTGLTLFVKKENPNSFTQTFFGWKFFSKGIVPQLLGLFMMTISSLAIFLTFWAFIH